MMTRRANCGSSVRGADWRLERPQPKTSTIAPKVRAPIGRLGAIRRNPKVRPARRPAPARRRWPKAREWRVPVFPGNRVRTGNASTASRRAIARRFPPLPTPSHERRRHPISPTAANRCRGGSRRGNSGGIARTLRRVQPAFAHARPVRPSPPPGWLQSGEAEGRRRVLRPVGESLVPRKATTKACCRSGQPRA